MGDCVRLSEITTDCLSDEEIQAIVYSGIKDNGGFSFYGLVFGNRMLLQERVNTAVSAYKSGRVKKLIFSGGSNGVSNQVNDAVPEAIRMRDLAIALGVPSSDILVEDHSNNSFENVESSFSMISSESLSSIVIITSEFHLKRCMAIIKKNYPEVEVIMIPSYDGFSDHNNWFKSDTSWNSGRSLATYEAGLLSRYARKGKIADLDVSLESVLVKR